VTRRPNFFIVGAPKSATTAMYEYLSQHPEIFMSPVKEPYYFGHDLVYLNIQRPTEDEYLSLFSGATDEKALGEASITYLVSERAAQEIKEFNPRAQIIIMLRNPIDMMYSMHSQALFTQVEDVKDFAKALSLEAKRKQGQSIPPKTTILSFILYRELATYSEQVKRYFEVFGRDRVRVIIYDDFKRDVSLAYQETLRFLGVDDQFQPESYDAVNINKSRRNEWAITALKHPQVVNAVRFMLPSRNLRQQIASKFQFISIKEAPRPPLSSELRAQLRSEFLAEVNQLSSLLDCDLTHWCQR